MNKNILLLAALASSCMNLSPHDNFNIHMSNTIGKHISDPYTWVRDDRHLSNRALDNGNIEHEYIFSENCRYFFEVEQGSGVIVKWRFEGNKKDCAIAP